MLKNYFITAVRNLQRYKAYSAISILGLAVGVACFLMIILYVQNELRYDQHIPHAERIYRVIRETTFGENTSSKYSLKTSGALAPALTQDFPEVETATKMWDSEATIMQEQIAFKIKFQLVDDHFLDVFPLHFLKGNRESALSKPNTVVLTASTARRLFGDINPIGKTLRSESVIYWGDYTVTGVVADLPAQSTIKIGAIHKTQLSGRGSRRHWETWRKTNLTRPIYTYVRLRNDETVKDLEQKLPEFMRKHLGDEIATSNAYHLQPLLRAHLYSTQDYAIESPGNIDHIYLLCAMGAFILLIACINYMNLSTARATKRAREVGMRKVVGAHRAHLLIQFLGESAITTCLALMLGIALASIALPFFNGFVNRDLSLTFDMVQIGALSATFVLVALLAGSYPALFLSAFRPMIIFNNTSPAGSKGVYLRKGLVIFQFALSILLIISTGVIYQQLAYIQNKDLGFDREHVIVMPIFLVEEDSTNEPWGWALRYNQAKEIFLQHPNVVRASAYRFYMGVQESTQGGPPLREIQSLNNPHVKVLPMPMQETDEDFLDTFGVELLKGRNQPGEIPNNEQGYFLFNESAVKAFGWDDPIGQPVKAGFWNTQGTVIGVVKNFHITSLHKKMGPAAIYFRKGYYNHLALRIKPNNLPETLAHIEQTWKHFIPNRPFQFEILDDKIAQIYNSETRLGQVFQIFSVLAIGIACLGLLGLAIFTAEQRTKEIGVRKVLGASSSNIVFMLSSNFIKLVLLANIIAWPVAYYTLNHWLQNFAYRITIGVEVFILSGILAFLIAFATVSYQAWKAARANPVNTLRCE